MGSAACVSKIVKDPHLKYMNGDFVKRTLSIVAFSITFFSGFALATEESCLHEFQSDTIAATCVKAGSITNTCTLCDYSETLTIKAKGHSYEETKKSATCTAEGSIAYKCKRCGDSYKETLPALGHDYKTTVVEPTMEAGGYTKHTCSRCSDSYKDNIVDKLTLKQYFEPLKMSEVMPCNLSTYINKDNYNFSGYLEFANTSSRKINLKGCVLTHYKKKSKGTYELKWKWEITSSLYVEPSSYGIVWMDESTKTNHAPYKLDTDGGYLTLYAEGNRIDSLAYDALDAHVAYGRYGETQGYMVPSPYAKNTAAYASLTSNRCAMPTFSQKPGVMSGATSVKLASATSGAVIYYTLDGTEPSESSKLLYTEPIEVSSNTNVRAIACKSGMLPSKIATGSYIFNDSKHSSCGGFTLPIVSVTIDDLYYDDDTYGMFVKGTNGINGDKDCQNEWANYNQDWKRPVNFEYIVDGKQVVSQEVEAAIEGGCSRREKIKSISLKASKKSGNNRYNYHFFNSKPTVFHQTLHLRNGGTAYSCVPFRDGLMQTFTHGMNVDYQAYQPVAYYLNGKYIGLMALNERANADYVKANYDYDEEDIDLISVSDQLGIRASKGDKEAYNELVSYLNDNDPASANYYSGACQRMDVDEYIDYQIFQQFIVNCDWPGNNAKMWRTKKDGLFRWILYDTDFGLGLCDYDWLCKSGRNMIDWCQGKGTTSWANQQSWMVNIFKPISKNEEFKRKFTTRYLIHLSNRFSEKNINAVFDSIVDLVSAEYCAYKGGSDALSSTTSMREFALKRPKYVYQHLTDYVEGDSAVDFIVRSNVAGAGLTLNGERLPSPYEGKYIAGYDFELKAYAPVGYEFDKWVISESSNVEVSKNSKAKGAFMPGVLAGELNGSLSIEAVFKKSSATPTLVINEVCSSSDSKSGNSDDFGEYPDWLELYNYGTEDINLAGFRIRNSKTGLVTELLDMVIKAGGHKLLWAKGESRIGDEYLNFKLDNDKPSQICLFYTDGTSDVTVDCMKYVTLAANASYGRMTDNSSKWAIFDKCDDNSSAATPGFENGSLCEGSLSGEKTIETSPMALYPNPATDYIKVETPSLMESYVIYDLGGMAVRQGNGESTSIDVSELSSGIYLIAVKTSDNVYRMKFVKQ